MSDLNTTVREALAAATPGPWEEHWDGTIGRAPRVIGRPGPFGTIAPWKEADSTLIANAPTWLAALVEENERLWGILANIGKRADGWGHGDECDDFGQDPDNAVCACGKGVIEGLLSGVLEAPAEVAK